MKSLRRLPDGFCQEWAEALPCRLALSFCGTDFEVRATSRAPLVYLERVYGFFLRTTAPSEPWRMCLFERGSEGMAAVACALRLNESDYFLATDWFGWGLALRNEALLRYYASKLLRLGVVERTQDQFLTLHCASLCRDGQGLLLIGEAASGKTSLCLRLLQRGFRHASDDTSCLRKRDLTCVPFPLPFIVRADQQSGHPPLPELRARPPDIEVLDEPRWLVDRRDAIASEFRPTHLIFLGANGPCAGELRPLLPALAVLRLMANIVFPLGMELARMPAARDIDLLANLAEGTECYEANTQDLDAALHNLLTLIKH
jgi:hypothetical protein